MAKEGFSFKVNPLFLLVIVLFTLIGMGREVLVAFSLVVLHEFVHFFVAWQAGYNIFKIELFPFGGMAEYEGLIEMEPGQEVKIALAGPLFNIIMAGLIYIISLEKPDIISGFISNTYLDLLIKYNLLLGIFNLLPALPLDGGRVLRGILVSKLGFKTGSQLAVKIAKWLSIIGAILGVIAVIYNRSNIWILFISFFVYGAAVKEENHIIYRLLSYMTHRHEFINKLRIKPVYCQVVRDDIFVKEVITHLLPDKYNLFYILDSDSRITEPVSEIKLLDTFLNLQKRDLRMKDLLE